MLASVFGKLAVVFLKYVKPENTFAYFPGSAATIDSKTLAPSSSRMT